MTFQQPDHVFLEEKEFVLTEFSAGRLFDPEAHGFSPGRISTSCYRGYMCDFRISDDRLFLDTLTIANKRPPTLGVIRDALMWGAHSIHRESRGVLERKLNTLSDLFTPPEISRGDTTSHWAYDYAEWKMPVFNGVTPEQDRHAEETFKEGEFVSATLSWSPSWHGYDIYRKLAFPLSYTGAVLLGANKPDDLFQMTGCAMPQDYDIVLQVEFEEGAVTACKDVSEIFATFRARYERNIYEDYDLDYTGPFPDLQRNGRRYLKRHLAPGFTF